uniref:Antifreeze protein n=1 Tax=Pseudomonas putida TaxID=303 RepID=Q68VA9_PSEPU|nr:antifreeze protein [Pseudomonas putida]
MQYDSPITNTEFQTFLTTSSISDDTAAAISTLLNLDSADTINLASWDGVNAPEIPTGQEGAADVVIVNVPGAATDLVPVEIPDSLNSAKAFIFDSNASLAVTFDAPVAAESASLARVAADTTAGIEFLVTTGAGNDVITVNGDQNSYIDAGNGNDTIVTGNGNNTVVAGAGNNNVTTGTGNDTIILSGTGHTDIVNTGAGYDVVQLDGSAADYTITAGNSNNVTLTGAQTAAITGAEFLTFADGSSVALAQSEAEASALRLYEGILGRDADQGGAQNFIAQVEAGTALTDIANSFLNSAEFGGAATEASIDSLYTSLLGRGADTAGSDSWEAIIANGGSLADVAAGIAGSAEAQEQDQSNGTFVDSLYLNALGRPSDEAGHDAWVAQLFNGASRAEVAAGIVGSAEAAEKINSDFIDALYLSATGRASDEAGKAGWTEVLANGGTQADVAIGIVGSQEAIAHNDNVVVLHGAV